MKRMITAILAVFTALCLAVPACAAGTDSSTANAYRQFISSGTYGRYLHAPQREFEEYLQAREFHVPVYAVVEVTGQQNSQVFRVSCSVEPLSQAVFGTGRSKRRAEQDAAEHVLEILRKSNGNRK